MFTVSLQKRCLAAALLASAAAALTLSAAAAAAPYSQAPVTEYTLLPKFCWGQFNDELVGEEYWIAGCGVGTNHYCEGLLDLQRSKKAKNLDQRKMMLGRAKTNTVYTIGWIQREGFTATCKITPHVQQTMKEIELQFQIYHIK